LICGQLASFGRRTNYVYNQTDPGQPADAKMSTGPKISEGKEHTRFNVLLHGLRAESAVIPAKTGPRRRKQRIDRKDDAKPKPEDQIYRGGLIWYNNEVKATTPSSRKVRGLDGKWRLIPAEVLADYPDPPAIPPKTPSPPPPEVGVSPSRPVASPAHCATPARLTGAKMKPYN